MNLKKTLEDAKALLKAIQDKPEMASDLEKAWNDKSKPATPPPAEKPASEDYKAKASAYFKKKAIKKDDMPHPAGSPQDKAHDVVEEHEAIAHAIKQLSPEQRKAMLAHLRTLTDPSKLRSPENEAIGKSTDWHDVQTEMRQEALKQQAEDDARERRQGSRRKQIGLRRLLGVHKPLHDPATTHPSRLGVSGAGMHAKDRNYAGYQMTGDAGTNAAAAKKKHADVLSQMRSMPKPNLPKAEKEPMDKGYEGFEAVKASAAKSGARNPAAVAATAGRDKYGKEAFQHAAATGHKMGKDEMVQMTEKAGESKHDRCVEDVERNSPGVKNAHAVCVAQGVRPSSWKKSEEIAADLAKSWTPRFQKNTGKYVTISQHWSEKKLNPKTQQYENPVAQRTGGKLQHMNDLHDLAAMHGRQLHRFHDEPKKEWGAETYKVGDGGALHFVHAHYDTSD